MYVVVLILFFQVKKMFLAADKDGDGKLSKEEWLEGKVRDQ